MRVIMRVPRTLVLPTLPLLTLPLPTLPLRPILVQHPLYLYFILYTLYFIDPRAASSSGEASPRDDDSSQAADLDRLPPPPQVTSRTRPDQYTYSIALNAMRCEAEQQQDSLAPRPKRKVQRTARAIAIARNASASGSTSGDGQAGVLSPPLIHSLICASGADVDAAIAVWRSEVRPAVSSLPRPSLQRAALVAYHALLRVCGLAGRADEALRICFAMRKDGIPADKSCWTAYANGKLSSKGGKGFKFNALQLGYEKLLEIECAPERAAKTMPGFGRVKRIRIQW